MELFASGIAITTSLLLLGGFFVIARFSPLGAMSLPCMTILTSLIYFYMMPALAFIGNEMEFLGLRMHSMDGPHAAVFLYIVGAVGACLAFPQILQINPANSRASDQEINHWAIPIMFLVCGLAIVSQVLSGNLTLVGTPRIDDTLDLSNLQLLNLFYTALVPLTLVVLIRTNFSIPSLILLLIVAYILLQTGFRYRLVLLIFGITLIYLLMRGIRIRTMYVLAGGFLGVLGSNIIVSSRTYGQGVDLTRLDGASFSELMRSFGGEVGPLFSFYYITENPIDPLILGDPWVVAVTGLVPRFLWPDKPYPDYLLRYFEGFGTQYARDAGVAAPQQAEILLQFDWPGLPVVAFLYFALVMLLLKRLSGLGREARLVGFALAPILFGMYMQTRGYFFQLVCDALFTFGPLFLLYLGAKRNKSAALSLKH